MPESVSNPSSRKKPPPVFNSSRKMPVSMVDSPRKEPAPVSTSSAHLVETRSVAITVVEEHITDSLYSAISGSRYHNRCTRQYTNNRVIGCCIASNHDNNNEQAVDNYSRGKEARGCNTSKQNVQAAIFISSSPAWHAPGCCSHLHPFVPLLVQPAFG